MFLYVFGYRVEVVLWIVGDELSVRRFEFLLVVVFEGLVIGDWEELVVGVFVEFFGVVIEEIVEVVGVI